MERGFKIQNFEHSYSQDINENFILLFILNSLHFEFRCCVRATSRPCMTSADNRNNRLDISRIQDETTAFQVIFDDDVLTMYTLYTILHETNREAKREQSSLENVDITELSEKSVSRSW